MATNTVKQHVPIFVSSTYKDLELHRQEVERHLIGLEQIVKGMEFFGSGPETPIEACFEHLSECKLMILLVGASYGSINEDFQKSYTEIEYDFAIENNIPVLVYLADMESPSIGIALSTVDTEHVQELNTFKEKLKKTHVVSFFTSIDDLGKRIEHDVPESLRKLNNIKITKTRFEEIITKEALEDGAYKFEQFWLRPSKYVGEIIPIRLRINKKWGGWKVKDDLIQALGLEVGDTISTEITVELTKGIIDDDDDTDLFASGDGADWLLKNAAHPGSVIDCFVRLSYCRAPVGRNEKMINTVALVFVKGIARKTTEKSYLKLPHTFTLSE